MILLLLSFYYRWTRIRRCGEILRRKFSLSPPRPHLAKQPPLFFYMMTTTMGTMYLLTIASRYLYSLSQRQGRFNVIMMKIHQVQQPVRFQNTSRRDKILHPNFGTMFLDLATCKVLFSPQPSF